MISRVAILIDGQEDPLNLIDEIKGYRRKDIKDLKATMETNL